MSDKLHTTNLATAAEDMAVGFEILAETNRLGRDNGGLTIEGANAELDDLCPAQ